MGCETAISKKLTKNVRSPKKRRRQMEPQQGMSFLSAHEMQKMDPWMDLKEKKGSVVGGH
jgi:hypothetical protein